tara:strand:- start:123 stop:1097 length:975 start_codon:yes stop_codon:yes gene_type:complete
MLISKNIYQNAMLNPHTQNGKSDLTVITGYSSPAMVERHYGDTDGNIKLRLLIGMGVGLRDRNAYLRLQERLDGFECFLMPRTEKIHSKLYRWGQSRNDIEIYVGSANYSQNGLIIESQKEILYKTANVDFLQFNQYINSSFDQAIPIEQIEDSQLIPDENIIGNTLPNIEEDLRNGGFLEITSQNGLRGYRISLLDRSGRLPQRSGLNWGQRPEHNREPNQAYIKVPAGIQRTDFFPERGIVFIVEDQSNDMVNDSQVFFAKRAQDNGKAIESTENNSIIGIYFRTKLGVSLGNPVELNHLIEYGKTFVDFYKIDDETFIVDF